jgi:cytochrome c biogenesis protein CcmG, thiol:disulfide interchange protein DsbE
MKTLLSTFILAFALSASAQTGEFTSIPNATVKDLDGKSIQTGELSNDGKPMIISMWATWCKPCIRELNAIKDLYPDWQEETGVKVIAISIDDARNAAKVRPFINGEGWEYEVYIDENQDLKRLLNVNSIPHTFLVNGNNEIVWQHNGYVTGDEEDLYELILKLVNGEEIGQH